MKMVSAGGSSIDFSSFGAADPTRWNSSSHEDLGTALHGRTHGGGRDRIGLLGGDRGALTLDDGEVRMRLGQCQCDMPGDLVGGTSPGEQCRRGECAGQRPLPTPVRTDEKVGMDRIATGGAHLGDRIGLTDDARHRSMPQFSASR